MSQTSGTTKAMVSCWSIGALLVAVVVALSTPVVGYSLGFAGTAKHSFIWALPAVAGAIPIVMGIVATGHVNSKPPRRGMSLAAIAITLGAVAPFLGWLALLLGSFARKGPMY